MEEPKLTQAHRELEKLVGSWTGQEHMFPSPWDPQGGPAVGSVQYRKALGGFLLVHDYEQKRNGAVSFRGYGVFSWDAAEQCYVLYWFDTMCVTCNEFRGKLNNGVLTMSSDSVHGHSRLVFDLNEKDCYGFRMDVSQDGKEWHSTMEGSYQRTS